MKNLLIALMLAAGLLTMAASDVEAFQKRGRSVDTKGGVSQGYQAAGQRPGAELSSLPHLRALSGGTTAGFNPAPQPGLRPAGLKPSVAARVPSKDEGVDAALGANTAALASDVYLDSLAIARSLRSVEQFGQSQVGEAWGTPYMPMSILANDPVGQASITGYRDDDGDGDNDHSISYQDTDGDGDYDYYEEEFYDENGDVKATFIDSDNDGEVDYIIIYSQPAGDEVYGAAPRVSSSTSDPLPREFGAAPGPCTGACDPEADEAFGPGLIGMMLPWLEAESLVTQRPGDGLTNPADDQGGGGSGSGRGPAVLGSGSAVPSSALVGPGFGLIR